MAKKKSNTAAITRDLSGWYFDEDLIDDPAFQSYVGLFGAYLTLCENTTNLDILETYITEACDQFAMLKTRCLINGIYQKYYAHDDEMFVQHVINFGCSLSNMLKESGRDTYMDTINKIHSCEGIEFAMNGGIINPNYDDPLMNYEIRDLIFENIITGFKAMLFKRRKARESEVAKNAVNRLVECGLTKTQSEEVSKMIVNNVDYKVIESRVVGYVEKNQEEHDIINIDPVIEDVDVDDLLKDWGLQ